MTDADKRLPHRVVENGKTTVYLGKVGFKMSPARQAQTERAALIAKEQAELTARKEKSAPMVKDVKLKG